MGIFEGFKPFDPVSWFTGGTGGGVNSSPASIRPESAVQTRAPASGVPLFPTLPSLLDITGAYLDYRAQKKNRKQQRKLHEENIALQKEFAQNGIQWRVQDALKAGLHPLAALGGGGASYSPAMSIGEEPSAGGMLRSMGQSISRAENANLTLEERMFKALQIESMSLDNAMKRKELEGMGQPPAPSTEKTNEIPATDAFNKWQQGGQDYPSVAYMRSPTGLVPIMPPELAEALESDQTNQAQWATRYKGGPNVFPTSGKPSNAKLPPGKIGWKWSRISQEWQWKGRKQAENEGRRQSEANYRSWMRATRGRNIGYERFNP